MRFVLMILVLLLSGCGQRGSLYLPDEPEPEAVLEDVDESGESDDETEREDTDAQPGAGGTH